MDLYVRIQIWDITNRQSQMSISHRLISLLMTIPTGQGRRCLRSCVKFGAGRVQLGKYKDISCRDLLRALDKKGLICLPAARWAPRTPGSGADKVIHVEHDTAPVDAKLRDIMPIRTEIVSAPEDVQLFKTYIHQYHYLGFDRSVGENIKYFVYSNIGTILACLMFGSASCADRDYYIGWNREQRARNLVFMTANTRYLILPWVHVPCLASHVLGAIARRLSTDWEGKYGHPLFLLETYVEPRFKGTCYRAANWRHVGETTGLGRNSKTGERVLPIKAVLLYPLRDDFRERLCNVRADCDYI